MFTPKGPVVEGEVPAGEFESDKDMKIKRVAYKPSSPLPHEARAMTVGVTTNVTRAGGKFPTGAQAYQIVAAGVQGTVEARLGPVKLKPFNQASPNSGEPSGKISLKIFVADKGWHDQGGGGHAADDMAKVQVQCGCS